MSKPEAIYRQDYQPSDYLIHTTELSFELFENETLVTAKVHYYQNPKVKNPPNSLFLNGKNLELIEILIDGFQPDYQLKNDGLQLKNLPADFVLEITTKIHPETNTSLNGLYKTSGNFCTQCEAHGFRQITYYLDRPDVLSVFTTRITADFKRYPILLSNGNLLENQPGTATWFDPHPKPCYLFALVAGDLAVLQDTFTTKSGAEVALKIYVEKHNISKTKFAMESLKRAFAWDERRFGLEYDLEIYMIVAVDDFNMGAMENKGLNIFNSKYVLANPDTATDSDFINIEAVIGHEYFHNWTGNRVTCQDWFQLSLKEGLTVFRDQEFTSDLHARSIKRITDVKALRTLQFAEDSGPMAHPVRPESYIEMNNFYTMTVYEKGAEVVRMIHTLLGEAGFQRGLKLYFQRYDGQAVTIDDFVEAMSEANNFDFADFMAWYSTSGTPQIRIKNSANKITISQPDERLFPLKYGVLDCEGSELESGVLIMKGKQKQFDFSHLPADCRFSWLRDFSAPVKLISDATSEQQLFLAKHDTDAFSRWDNMQKLWQKLILNPDKIDEKSLFLTLENMLKKTKTTDNSLLSELLKLPSEHFLHQQIKQINVIKIRQKRELVIQKIIQNLEPLLLKIYQQFDKNEPFNLTPEAVGKRALRNICLAYLVKSGKTNFADLAFKQFKSASCMSDRLSAFEALLSVENQHQKVVIKSMFERYKNDTQVMDKWFAAQALAAKTTVSDIKKLMQNPLFCFDTPNRLRSVIGSFTQNFAQFHNQNGYQLLTKIILKLNISNPQIGARLLGTYSHWRRFTPELKALQKQQLEIILASKNLSNDIFEITQTALK